MLANPFAFLRGAAAGMAEDLRHEPTAGIPVQACGDCHLMNFGAFVTPEQNILFDINDFDDTPGVDFTADLKRLGASVAVVALAANLSKQAGTGDRGDYCRSLSHPLRSLAKRSPLEIWHSRVEFAHEIKRIEHRGSRSELQGILFKARDNLVQDDNFRHLVKRSAVLLLSLTRTPQFSAAPFASTGMQRSWLILPLVHVPPAPCYVSWTCIAGSCLTCSVKSIFFDKLPSKRSFGWDRIDVSAMTHTIPLHRRQDTQRWAPPHQDPDSGNYRAMTEYRVGTAQSKSLSPPSFDGPQVQLI